ncbi:MAG: hypothetical protein HYY17_01325 [Planctomycetes bacterium]|nr:hypothetical protein [Planctomycetota bacterium]
MKRMFVSLAAAMALLFVGAGCGSPKDNPEIHSPKVEKKYACPMKCATSDSPGKCPKCGMEMEERR